MAQNVRLSNSLGGIMAFGIDLDSILSKLGENPQIAKVIAQVTEVCNGVVLAMAHFNKRFDLIESQNTEMLLLLRKSEPGAAAPDGLMQLLAENGEEMQMQTVEPIPIVNEVKH